MPINAKTHYDTVTDAWTEFMGENFHFGYFESDDTELALATELLIEKMLEYSDIDGESRVLDVGCGIGGPAFYMYEKYGCSIDGISTSERGVQMASAASREKGYDSVRFKVADGVSNGFPDRTFDVVWIMEATHLIRDKRGLFKECNRVLKDDGTLVLCDIMQMKLLPVHKGLWHFVSHGRGYYTLMKTFGPAEVLSPGLYCDRLMEAGFSEITAVDISRYTLNTMRWWRDNALNYGGGNEADDAYTARFMRGCEILEGFFRKGLFGYGVVRATK
ncbi:MAG: methyltransferase domain-containing protein [Actinobacteria bacterium]|nr:methyltransferase domain-containing protein [Actinomycetota bacterium]